MARPGRSQQTSLFRPLLATIVLYISLGQPHPAYAYLDPGSGSMMLQLLLGGVAGIAVLLKMTWQRMAERVRLMTGSRRRPL